MPRPPRLHVAGGYYHVTLRGNHRRNIFFRASDYSELDAIVAAGLVDTKARLHAYCWMENHIHMLVQVGERPLGELMQRIASRYARRVQHDLGTTGHFSSAATTRC